MPLSKSLGKKLTSYGSWALVTGASSGIGKELAERLAEAGLNIALVGRAKTTKYGIPSIEGVAKDFESEYGVETKVFYVDLSNREASFQILAETDELDIGLLVTSAGFGTSGELIHSSIEEELNMLDVNCGALLMFTRYFSKKFAEKRKGGIILLSSMVAFQGVPYAGNYAATKAYVQSLGEAIAHELKPHNVDVLVAAPGPVNSNFAHRAQMNIGKVLKPSDIGVEILKSLGKKHTVLPGLLTKFLVTSLRTVPRWGKVRLIKIVMGGMTKHQRQLQLN
jgi:hypothetical protein